MVTEVKPEQPSNALSPIEVTEAGIIIEVRPEQPSNAPSPIEVTESGIVTEVRPVQPVKVLLVDYQYYTL